MTVIYESVIEVDITKCMKLTGAVPSLLGRKEEDLTSDIVGSAVYSLQFTVYSLQSTVYSLQSTVYSLQSTVYIPSSRKVELNLLLSCNYLRQRASKNERH